MREDDSYDLTIHQSACRNQECGNAKLFRENGSLMKSLKFALERTPTEHMTEELKKSLRTIDLALKSPIKLYDYNTCLDLSDVWIHLECVKSGMKNLLTTNFSESRVLCPGMGLTMLDATSPPPASALEAKSAK
ncbi:MAG TPA: hypothetical protein VKD71_06925 [Gemmataceae bacterium]|nr:hypothetical protein [Gemmataceae bacterium]